MSNDTPSVCQETGVMTPFVTMSLRVHSICFQVLYGYLLLGMLYWGYGRVSPDGAGPGMLPMVSKELGNAGFNAIMSWTWVVVQGDVALGDCTLGVEVWGQR